MEHDGKTEMDIEFLKRIAEYYEFPFAVFFMEMKDFPAKTRTRNESLIKKAEAYDRIMEIENEIEAIL